MKHIPTFESFLNESRYSIYKKEIEWKQHPKKSGSYIAKSGKSELEILSSGYGNWELRVDGKEVMPSETAKEKSTKDNHTNYNNWADDKVGTLKHTAQEMFESFLNESKDEVIFSIDDDKLDQLLRAKFSKEIDYEDVKGDSYYALPKKAFDRFIDLADSSGFDVDYDGSEKSVVYVYESLRSGPNDANTYPIKKSDNPEDLLSSRTVDRWSCETAVSDLLDVFGEEMSIYKGDEITQYIQVNSKDPVAHIYEIVRRDRRGRRIAGYIPSHYRNYSQTKEINSTRF